MNPLQDHEGRRPSENEHNLVAQYDGKTTMLPVFLVLTNRKQKLLDQNGDQVWLASAQDEVKRLRRNPKNQNTEMPKPAESAMAPMSSSARRRAA
jgi:hypothetical protein